MKEYLSLLSDVIHNGEIRDDRTGVGTISQFGKMIKVDLSEGYPAVTTKKLAFKSMTGELLWFMNNETTLSSLRYRTFGSYESEKPTIWDANQADFFQRVSGSGKISRELLGVVEQVGGCGLIYGHQWNRENQLYNVIQEIINNPSSRRLLVSAWDYPDVADDMKVALPPCHYAFQFNVREGKYLDLMWHQRSADLFLGCPYNIASYALLCHIVAAMTNLQVGKLTGTFGDTHIYKNHIDQVTEQLKRLPYEPPELVLPSVLTDPDTSFDEKWKSLNDLTANDFALTHYDHHPAIKAPMAV